MTEATAPRVNRARLELLKTRIAIILDRSSSMGSMKDEARDVFNKQVETIQQGQAGVDTKVSLVTFSTTVDEPMIWNRPVSEIRPLADADYQPSGMTALYDAIGSTIDKLQELPEASNDDTSFLLIIITDGDENNSHKYEPKQVASKLKELQETDRWTITYLGSNQDLTKVQADLGLRSANMLSYDSSSQQGMRNLSNAAVGGTAMFMSARSDGESNVGAVYDTSGGDAILDADELAKAETQSGDITGNSDSVVKE